MIKVDIFSGFLGAGKTTLIRKLIDEAYKGEKLVLIENEFGDIGIDGDFLKDSGVQINEINSGCICCTLVGDFKEALAKVVKEYEPERILIEPSGVGKLSDVIDAVKNCGVHEVKLNSFTTVCDAKKVRVYMQNFGEFYNNQVEYAGAIVLSHTEGMSDLQLEKVVRTMKEKNPKATILTTPLKELTGSAILEALEGVENTENILKSLEEEAHHIENENCNHHDHHHGGEGHGGCCGHKKEGHCEKEHGHDHHDHDHHHGVEGHGGCCEHKKEENCGKEHGHDHHDHDHHHGGKGHENCGCGHDHGNEGHHHADEVFDSIGTETALSFDKDTLNSKLEMMQEREDIGFVLRAKGVLRGTDGKWIHFDYVPGEINIREGSPAVIGRICVIGTNLNKDEIYGIFFE